MEPLEQRQELKDRIQQDMRKLLAIQFPDCPIHMDPYRFVKSKSKYLCYGLPPITIISRGHRIHIPSPYRTDFKEDEQNNPDKILPAWARYIHDRLEAEANEAEERLKILNHYRRQK